MTAVGVLATVGHRQKIGFVVLQGEVLVVESAAVDRLAARSISAGKVPRLDHEAFHNSVEHNALETR